MEKSNSLIYQNIKEYFSNINPIAKKISNEIEQIQSIYGDLWITFSDKEKSVIINDTLISPDISLLYYNLTTPLISSNSQISQLDAAASQVKNSDDGRSLDGVHSLFRDEHSSPFSYRTKSQIDLTNGKLVPWESEARPSFKEKAFSNKLQLTPVDKKSEKINNGETNENQTHNKTKSNNVLSNIMFLRQKVSTSGEPAVGKNNKEYYKSPVMVSTSCAYQKNKELYEEDDELSNLINNCNSANESATSLMSLEISDEETHANTTEKTLCDKVALLDHESNIRKGFDFLNNW